MTELAYVVIFLFGIVFGSFLNVCIVRIPEGESIVFIRSHCMNCGEELAWYDLIPLFSYIFLGGKCRYCKDRISLQYPIVELLNGLMWCYTFYVIGWRWEATFTCAVISALIVIAVIDFRTYEIPFGAVLFIFTIGVMHLMYVIVSADPWIEAGISSGVIEGTAFEEMLRSIGLNAGGAISQVGLHAGVAGGPWYEYVIGLFAVSVPLFIIYLVSRGRGIGGGDVKLMAAAGLFLGWKYAILALMLGCLFGSVIHIARMKISGEGSVLAMGPYLAAGIICALWFGQPIIEWYMGLLG